MFCVEKHFFFSDINLCEILSENFAGYLGVKTVYILRCFSVDIIDF